MRCPDCCKFVSMDTETEPEFDEPSAEDVIAVCTVDVRITNNCADCGTELKEANFSLELEGAEPGDGEKTPHENCKGELTLDFVCERSDRSDSAKNPRYARTFYGVEVTVEVKCEKCGFKHNAVVSDECQASGMDELV